MDANSHSDTGMDLEDAIQALRSSDERLGIATEALRKSEERATAGRLALEEMHEINNPLEAPTKASPDVNPNTATATAIASSKSLPTAVKDSVADCA